ncbi:aldose 1-epimerase [Telmatospirillum siberiense]|uniref:Aldose 1-epimerase n=1 Tax=Telmatospirillum siberiense TaxID=382514 RepID=A0A2N3Q1Q8_9PROT|nr:aldose 1-epimerase [Telmatospirillum siberiense]PKU26589.1 aldose 1-epimerase [Telmatospirillum siberiense]
MTNSDFVSLTAGTSRLTLWPETGGAIVDWQHDGISLFRNIPDEALAAHSARRLGCFPLIPYSNRIARASLTFGEETYALRPDLNGEPHSIHGNGWYTPWIVTERTDKRLVLTLDHQARGDGVADWPFSYVATQTFSLGESGLDIALRIENRDGKAMPAGFGLHPYFRRTPKAQMMFQAASVWLNGADKLPRGQQPVPSAWSFATLRSPAEAELDHCFAGWNGTARIVWPEDALGLTIEASAEFSHLVVYTPAERDFFCVEPVSHMNDAMNRMDVDGHGVAVLAPGQALEGGVRFRLDRLA